MRLCRKRKLTRSRRTASFACSAARVLVALACMFSRVGGIAAAGEYEVRIDVTEDVRALGSEDAFEWEPAADRLSALGAAAWPVLLRALETESPAGREGIVGVLASATEAGDSVLRGLERVARADPVEEVRVDAVQ